MTDLAGVVLKAAEGYEYSAAPQRTPAWYDLRIGKVTASRLEDFLAVSKAKNSAGKKLKKRTDYELELLYERQFKVAYNNYVTEAMMDGIQLEEFALAQAEKLMNIKMVPVGAWYNDKFVASPDGAIDEDGLAEAKVLRDNSFSELLTKGFEGSLNKYWKQMQGQLRASGRKYVLFVAINLNTKKIYIIRVERDEEFMEWLDLNLEEELTAEIENFDTGNLHDFVDEAPDIKEEMGF